MYNLLAPVLLYNTGVYRVNITSIGVLSWCRKACFLWKKKKKKKKKRYIKTSFAEIFYREALTFSAL